MYSVSCVSIYFIIKNGFMCFQHQISILECFQHCKSSDILFHMSVYSTQQCVNTWTNLQSHCSHVFSHCCSPASESIDGQVLTLNKHSLNHWNRSCTSAAEFSHNVVAFLSTSATAGETGAYFKHAVRVVASKKQGHGLNKYARVSLTWAQGGQT